MQGLYERTLARINDGRSGRVLAIPTPIRKYNEIVYGTRQSCYYLYGGETGTGKTRLARDIHIYASYDYYKQVNDDTRLDVEYLDLSLEISAEENMACAMARKIYLETGRVVPMERILSLDGRLNDDIYELILTYRPYFEAFEQKMHVIDEDITPTKYHDLLMFFAKKNGTFEKEGRYISECSGYVPHNRNKYFIILLDTINLSEVDSGHETVKSSIDRISRISVWFRNKCGMTPIIIQQFNAEISAVDRNRYGIKTPLLRDFEDSKRPTKDANVVFGLFEPIRHMRPDETQFMGYDMNILRTWFRSLHLLKHRNGPSNKFIPLQYKGAVGMFSQMPDANTMTPELYAIATRY